MRYACKSLSLLLAALLVVGLTGCDSLTEGYDEDPNDPTDASVELVLNSAQVASILFQDGNHARIAGVWSGHLTGSDRQYLAFNNYDANASAFDNMWITGYADVIGDLAVAKRKARAANNRLILGIAKTVEAHTFGTKAALHGDIPFTEASQGNENLNPAFDAQADVYQGVIDSLDAAIADLEAGGISPGGMDIFYGGDAEAWIEAAYTLKARYLLHTAQYAEALTAAQNGISSPENNMMAPHGNSNYVDANPFYLFHDIERTGYMTANDSYAAGLLDEETDDYRGDAKTDESARFAYYFTGEEGAYDLNTAEGGYFGQASDYPLVTYVENELIRAEAILQSGGAASDALAALNNARAAHAVQFGEGTYEAYALSDFASGGIANPGGMSQENALLYEILEEKYLSLMAHIETFNDLRRTDNFIGIPIKSGSQLPQRFLIAQTEINANNNISEGDVQSLSTPTPVNAQIDYTGVN